MDSVNVSSSSAPSAANLTAKTPAGSVPVTVLIRDRVTKATTCHSIDDAAFRTISEILDDSASNTTINSMLDEIESMVNITDLSTVVVLYSAIEQLYQLPGIDTSDVQPLIVDIIESVVEFEPQDVADVTSEVATLTTLTASAEMLGAELDVTQALIEEYLPNTLYLVQNISRNASVAVLFAVAQQIQE